MINKDDKFYNYVRENYNYDDIYNNNFNNSILTEHRDILKIILINLKLTRAEFFSFTTDSFNFFNYCIKINDQRYLRITMKGRRPDTCLITFINFISNDTDKIGDIQVDLTKSLNSIDIKNQFNIAMYYIETGKFSPTPVERFTFNRGLRGSRFAKRR